MFWSHKGQIFEYVTLNNGDNNPQIVKALDLDNDEHYVLTPKLVFRKALTLFETKQVQSAISPKTFTAKEAGIYSNAELQNFGNRGLFTKHSDSTVKFPAKTFSFDFLAPSEKHPNNIYSNSRRNRLNPYNVLRACLHNHFLNIAPLFALNKFADVFDALFVFQCYSSTC